MQDPLSTPSSGGRDAQRAAPDLWSSTAAPSSAGGAPSSAAGVPWERAAIERLLMTQVREQRAARRWRVFFRLAWLLVAAALVALIWMDYLGSAAPVSTHTAMVEIRGEIASGAPASAETVIAAMRSALEEPNAKALVLLINSPGGSPVQAGMITDEIRRLRALHQKPIYAVVEEMCASAAYYIAAAADDIFVDKASMVGSIGVLMDGFGFTGTMEKLGVERRLLTAGEHKGFLDPFSPQDEQETVYAQRMLDQIHAQFIQVVREGRGQRLKEDDKTFTGLIWTGQEAIAQGLADRLGSIDMVARDVVQAEEVIDYTRRANMAERLVKRFGVALGEGFVRAMHSAGVQLR